MTSKPINAIKWLAAGAFTFSLAHHAFNFWELELWKQAALTLLFLPVFLPLSFFFRRLNPVLPQITARRWAWIFPPAALAAFIFAFTFFRAPSVWHTLTIQPEAGQGSLKIYEIKYPPRRILPLNQSKEIQGWQLGADFILAEKTSPAPLTYTFFAPIGQPVEILFLRAPSSRDAALALDGRRQSVNLMGEEESLQPVRLVTAYKMGIPAAPILGFIYLADFFSVFGLILLLWLIQEAAPCPQKESATARRIYPVVLLALAILFHALNFFSVPLTVASDSPSYLSGAIHWMQYHNFDGVPAARGPGMTFLFLPAFLLAGDHPWGIKLTLHLFAFAIPLLAYALAFRLYRRRGFAFTAGLLALFLPEVFLYSNIVMSDVPNAFFALAYSVTLLDAMQSPSWKNLAGNMLLGTFAVLLRAENLVLLALGAGFLSLQWVLKKQGREALIRLVTLFVLAALPLLGWSAHNLRIHGFFGLSNYADEVLYDGWIYYGEASGFPLTDSDSPAVQSIQEALSMYDQPLGETVVPTGWEIYPALLADGYDENESIHLLGDAARDSILRDPALSWKLYLHKLKKSFVPLHSGVTEKTFPADGTPYRDSTYFQSETTPFPFFIAAQERIHRALPAVDNFFSRPLVFLALAAAFFALYQRDGMAWLALTALALSRMFLPTLIGIGHWHYMLAGILILIPFALLPLQWASGFFDESNKKVAP